jgi:membrane protein
VKLFKNALGLVKDTFKEWSNDKAPRLGAALSYYTIFSLAPLLLLVIAVAGLAFGREAAEGRIVGELSGLIGADAAEALQGMIEKAGDRKGGVLATVIGGLTLLLGATGVLVELQDALNTVWKVIPKPGRGLRAFIRTRLLSFSLVLCFGFLLIVSLVASAGLAALGGWLADFIPGWVVMAYILNYGVSIGVIALLLALIFKVLPDVRMAFRDVWIGALVTSLLFHLGKFLIGLYIGKASVGSTFGAAGSLAVLLVWIYYSSQLVLLGAEFTRVYANRFGSHVEPTENAVAVPETPLARLAAEKRVREGKQPLEKKRLGDARSRA